MKFTHYSAMCACILGISFMVGCCTQKFDASYEHLVTIDSNLLPSNFSDTFKWQEKSPMEFLASLRTNRLVYTVVGKHFGWIRDADLRGLASRLDSKEPCAGVSAVTSAEVYLVPSTIGREAAFLIAGYRKGYYPPGPTSASFEFDPEFLAWLAELKNAKGVP